MKTKYSVISGPSKFELFARYGLKIDGHRVPMIFNVTQRGGAWSELHVVLNDISWEDGSGESWSFGGYVTRFGWLPRGTDSGQAIHGWYRTGVQNVGWIEVDGIIPSL